MRKPLSRQPNELMKSIKDKCSDAMWNGPIVSPWTAAACVALADIRKVYATE